MDENKNTTIMLQADYERAEIDLLKEALKRSYKERFLVATTLYKIQQTMSKAKIPQVCNVND